MAIEKVSKIALLVVGFALFFFLTQIYFQQDEWHSFGLILGYDTRYLTLDKPIWQLLLLDRAGARVITYVLFHTAGLQSYFYGIYAWVAHILNTILVIALLKRIVRNSTASYLGGLFFLVNQVSSQGYVWFGTMVGTATALTFVLASTHAYIYYTSHSKKRFLVVSMLLLYVSFLFKEVGYLLFIVLPVIWLTFANQKTLRAFINGNIAIFAYGFTMSILFLYSILSIPGDRVNYVSTDHEGLIRLITRLVLYPVEGSIQTFLPTPLIFGAARRLTLILAPSLTPDTPAFDLFYQTVGVETLTIGFAIAGILVVFRILSAKAVSIHCNRGLKIGLTWLAAGFLPYIVLSKFDAYFDSRYYYASSVGAALILGSLVQQAVFIKNGAKKIVLNSTLLLLILAHVTYLIMDLEVQRKRSITRKSILKQIIEIHPTLEKKTVFFVTGNSPGYYGLEELKVPFQSGLGQMLLVVYVMNTQLDPIFLTENSLLAARYVGFLYDTLGQGYREYEEQGFGYFFDKRELNRVLVSGQFDEKDIVALFYDSNSNTIYAK